MRLLLDIGNTRIKWALQQLGAAHTELAVCGDLRRSDESVSELCLSLDDALIRACGVSGFRTSLTSITAVNVGGQSFGRQLAVGLNRHFGFSPDFIKSESSAFGLRNGYTDISQLGVDRWVAMLAVVSPDGRDFCVVDAGTAVTIDYVDAGLLHQGGLIFPGLHLMQQALFARTGDIKDFAGKTSVPEDLALLGRTTEAAVRFGAVQSTVGAVQRVLDSASQTCRLIVTGGDAAIACGL
jgi:type III pantothenate kinase